jgi:saposin
LEKSCSRLKKFSSKCKKFVDKYSDKIVELIEQELGPEEICRQLVFCVTEDEIEFQDYDSGLEILTMSEKKTEFIDEISIQPQCVICEFVVAKIDDELNDKNVTEHLKQEIRNICSKMPQTINKECQQFIDYYYNMIIMMIETTKPADMCGEMKLCPLPKLNQKQLVGMIQNDIYKCALCKGIVEGLDTIIEDPYTDANLENLEEKLCVKFAGKYKTKVRESLNYFDFLI